MAVGFIVTKPCKDPQGSISSATKGGNLSQAPRRGSSYLLRVVSQSKIAELPLPSLSLDLEQKPEPVVMQPPSEITLGSSPKHH